MLQWISDALMTTFRGRGDDASGILAAAAQLHVPTHEEARVALMQRASEVRKLLIQTGPNRPRASAYWVGYITGLKFGASVILGKPIPIAPYAGEEDETT